MTVTGYKIIMNNDSIYTYDTVQEPSDFLESVSRHKFIKAYKYATENDGRAVRLTVFLSTKISVRLSHMKSDNQSKRRNKDENIKRSD